MFTALRGILVVTYSSILPQTCRFLTLLPRTLTTGIGLATTRKFRTVPLTILRRPTHLQTTRIVRSTLQISHKFLTGFQVLRIRLRLYAILSKYCDYCTSLQTPKRSVSLNPFRIHVLSHHESLNNSQASRDPSARRQSSSDQSSRPPKGRSNSDDNSRAATPQHISRLSTSTSTTVEKRLVYRPRSGDPSPIDRSPSFIPFPIPFSTQHGGIPVITRRVVACQECQKRRGKVCSIAVVTRNTDY